MMRAPFRCNSPVSVDESVGHPRSHNFARIHGPTIRGCCLTCFHEFAVANRNRLRPPGFTGQEMAIDPILYAGGVGCEEILDIAYGSQIE